MSAELSSATIIIWIIVSGLLSANYCQQQQVFELLSVTIITVFGLLSATIIANIVDTKNMQPQQSWPWQGCDNPTRIHALRKYVGQAEDRTSVEMVQAKQ